MNSRTINDKNGKIINFYSFKGGVGRTVTLRNVASILKKKGYKIAIVDMDLECPGLTIIDSYKAIKPKDTKRQESISFLEIAKGYLKCINEKNDESSFKHANNYIKKHLTKYLDKDFLQIVAHGGSGENLTEGDFDEYVRSLKYLEFNQFNSVVGHFLEFFLKMLKNNFDYVLIDNRTGLSEASIWNIRKFSDLTVWVLTLSIQNLEGVRLTFNRFSLPLDNSSSPDYSSFIFVANISPPLPKFINENTLKLSKLIASPRSKIINIEYAPEPIFNELFKKFPKINIQYQNIVNAILESDEKTTAYRKRYAAIGCMFFSITELENELRDNKNIKSLIESSGNYKYLIEQISESDSIESKLDCINMLFNCMFKNKAFSMIVKLYNELVEPISSIKNNKLLPQILIKAYASLIISGDKSYSSIEERLDNIYFKGLLSDIEYDPNIEIIGSSEEYNMYINYRLSNIYNILISDNSYDFDNITIILFLKLWYLLSEDTISLRTFVWPPQERSSVFPLLDKLFSALSPKRNTFLFNALACINTDINNNSVPDNIVICLENYNEHTIK